MVIDNHQVHIILLHCIQLFICLYVLWATFQYVCKACYTILYTYIIFVPTCNCKSESINIIILCYKNGRFGNVKTSAKVFLSLKEMAK